VHAACIIPSACIWCWQLQKQARFLLRRQLLLLLPLMDAYLAFSPAGRAVDSSTAANNASVQNGMRTALRKLHEVGILHGDVRLSNFCIADDGHVKVIDFDRAYDCGLAARAEAAKQEEQQLEGLLQPAPLAAAVSAAATI